MASASTRVAEARDEDDYIATRRPGEGGLAAAPALSRVMLRRLW